MIDHFPRTLIGKAVLRVEGQFRTKSLKKWICTDNNWQIIRDTYKNANKILKWYMKRVQPQGDILRYKDAVSLIEGARIKAKTCERMMYLLRKTSDRDSLSTALNDLQKTYHLNKCQCRTVLKKFQQLGISLITLRNDSKFDMLPDLQEYIG